MGCLDAAIPEQLLRRSDIKFLVTNGHGETTRTTVACLELWLFTCMDQFSWKQMQLNCSVASSPSLDMTQLTSEECQWIILFC